MIPDAEIQVADDPETNYLAAIGSKIDFCMGQYHPYLRPDLTLDQLSVITNIPVSSLENFFNHALNRPFNQYLDSWRIKHVKKLMDLGKAKGLELKTLGLLSGFSSERKFVEAYKRFEGHSPEMDF
jgi:transcriptional regulator GlxA family with amidase domain